VVDDSGINREILAAQVQAEGYLAVTAKDGKQAIEMIQTGTFDLILLDIYHARNRWLRSFKMDSP
jgi:CheY-like chemotaxis protein